MAISPEEFFMYLIIGLIIAVPLGARLYRYAEANRVKRMLREELDKPSGSGPAAGTPS
jgi:hypothetical protein